jgi:hypothetical protein
MPLNIPAGSFEVAFTHQHQATLKVAVCTIGMTYTGASFSSDALAAEAAWGSEIMPHLTSVWHFVRTDWREAAGIVRSNSVNVAGGNGGAAMTPQVAYLARKSTALAGRKNRGRMYLPGVTETEVDGAGLVSAAFQGDMNTAFAALITSWAGNDLTPVILHNSLEAPTAIDQLTLESVVATQRRRLR